MNNFYERWMIKIFLSKKGGFISTSTFKFSVLPVGIHGTELIEIFEVSGWLIIDFSTLLTDSVNGLWITIEIGCSIINSWELVLWDEFLKDLVKSLGGSNLMDQFFIDFSIITINIELVQEIVDMGISGIGWNSGLCGFKIFNRIKVFAKYGEELILIVGSQTLECTNWLTGEGEITPLHNLREYGSSLNSLKLLLKGPGFWVWGLSVLHPVDGEFITKTWSNIFSVNLIIRWTIGGPTWFSWVSSWDGIDWDVVWEMSLEHGTRFTGLKIESELFILFVCPHCVECSLELVGV